MVFGLVATAVLGLADATPADEGTRPAAGEQCTRPAAGEQDVQHQARPSVINVAPATRRPRKHLVTLTGRPFLPVPRKSACRLAAEQRPQLGTRDWRRLLPRGEDLLRAERGAGVEGALAGCSTFRQLSPPVTGGNV